MGKGAVQPHNTTEALNTVQSPQAAAGAGNNHSHAKQSRGTACAFTYHTNDLGSHNPCAESGETHSAIGKQLGCPGLLEGGTQTCNSLVVGRLSTAWLPAATTSASARPFV